jgi:toxin ParE1/3/4
MKLVFTPLAEIDLYGIISEIAAQRPGTARAVAARIRKKCRLLAGHPFIGERLTIRSREYRCFPVQRWIIFYRVVEQTVQIHRVLDGARDWPAVLDIPDE